MDDPSRTNRATFRVAQRLTTWLRPGLSCSLIGWAILFSSIVASGADSLRGAPPSVKTRSIDQLREQLNFAAATVTAAGPEAKQPHARPRTARRLPPVERPSATKPASRVPQPHASLTPPTRSQLIPLPNQPRQTQPRLIKQTVPLKSQPMTAAEPKTTATRMQTVHQSRLREVAYSAMQFAYESYRRGAMQTARKRTSESLQAIAAMRDVAFGGSAHQQHLATALTALRESKDFGGRYGPLNPPALRRMIRSHETSVLKPSLESVDSPLQAMDAYLRSAESHLVAACGRDVTAGNTLVLLGLIERQMSSPQDVWASAVALTHGRASVQVNPSSAFAYRELGRSLLAQGFAQHATQSLSRSIEISPSRSAYSLLQSAHQRLGNVEAVRQCQLALQDPGVRDHHPVRWMEPAAFAATHRVDPSQAAKQSTKSPTSVATRSDRSVERQPSVFEFWRR